MSDSKLPSATLVANPTSSSWSQAYTAGKLYAVLSLTQPEEQQQNLASIGKDIINTLVEEYFTLETKNLETIKSAVLQTTTTIPKDLQASFVVVSIVQNILYAYSLGGGCVSIKRGEKIGTILKTRNEEETLHSASGYLKQEDSIILQTKQAADIITENDLQTSFETPADAIEMLSPKVHGSGEGGASAIIISYIPEQSPLPTLADIPTLEEEKNETNETEEKEAEQEVVSPLQAEVAQHSAENLSQPSRKFPKLSFSFPKLSFHLPIKTLFFLLIPLLLLLVLAASIYKTKQHQETSKIQQDFDAVYPQAQKKYDEGVALLSLNKPLAQDDFSKAQKIIDDNINKFPAGSSQRKQMEELLTKVKNQGVKDTNTSSLTASETNASNSPVLAALSKNTSASYVTSADSKIYVGSNKGIFDATGKPILTNDTEWKTMAGLGAFGTNLYVLDKGNNEILKFLGGSADAKSTYASGSFNNAVDMTIDSSIYVLFSDGIIKKFTKGSPDSFSVTGLETPLKSPTRIVTTPDSTSVYVLDKGNGRVIVLDKSGGFQTAYTATILKQAAAIDVHETDKKLYILASGKIYEISLP